ncbi:MAG: hypothetical protein IDH49_14690 [Gammaproteobacteria bacterium]|nr:hypothetical protein [Gammaproteobacteria bacterium]
MAEDPCKQGSDLDFLVEALNSSCHCISLDREALRREMEDDFALRDLYRSLAASHPYLFSALPVFVSRHHVDRMAEIIHAIESVIAMPVYREHVMQWAPEIARFDPGPRGVFLGYDFHLGLHGPQLIEINTNAGGALLNTVLARAQRACCADVEGLMSGPVDLPRLEEHFFGMFMNEWRRQRGDQPLRSIAIVDDAPNEQYLYPEFLLFQQMFERFGLETVIANAKDLVLRSDELQYGAVPIDMVYNRLTDFSLEQAEHTALRQAYREDAVVLTPHPRAHALYADKRNLVVLSDQALLSSWGVAGDMIALLAAGIPRTIVVDPAHADELWQARRGLFFKPATGFGGKAAYRGDKLTRRVWDEILAGRYVAQMLVPPSERVIQNEDVPLALKLDLRNYVYDGKVQLLAARLYQGQTTNFRTPGGGFSPVFHPV